jgi:hypothetical protein
MLSSVNMCLLIIVLLDLLIIVYRRVSSISVIFRMRTSSIKKKKIYIEMRQRILATTEKNMESWVGTKISLL